MNRYAASAALALALGASGHAAAALIDRGNGLIYDDVLDITWMQDANYAMTSGHDADGRMSLADSQAYVDGLVYMGFDDWRLPTIRPVNGVSFDTNSWTTDGSTDMPYSQPGVGWTDANGDPTSELGHLYYVTLLNAGYYKSGCTNGFQCDQLGVADGFDFNTKHVGPFLNVHLESTPSIAGYLLSETTWNFSFNLGAQTPAAWDYQNGEYVVWAVRDGDSSVSASVPLPSTLFLFGITALSMGYRRLRGQAG